MNYMQEVDPWLTELLMTGPEGGETPEVWLARAKRTLKDKLLESYRNGQRDCPKCNPRKGSK